VTANIDGYLSERAHFDVSRQLTADPDSPQQLAPHGMP